MRTHSVVAIALVALLAACGGDKPAESPTGLGGEGVDPGGEGAAGGGEAGDEMARGTSAVKAGDWNAAREAFEAAVRKEPKRAEAHYYLGLVMDRTGDRAAGERSYRQALSLDPNLQEAAENLTAILVEEKKYDDAIVVAQKALAKNPKNAEMQLNLAVALSEKGDEAAATKAFEDAVKLAPNDARFFLAYAHHLSMNKKTDDAVQRLKQAQRVAGEDAALHGTIGFELRTARAVPDCIAAFDKAISLKDNADFRTNRALCKYAAKDKAGAISDLEAATQKEPDFGPAQYWLASWHHEDGKYAEAKAGYETYLKVAPGGPMAKAAEAKLKLAKEKKKPAAPKK